MEKRKNLIYYLFTYRIFSYIIQKTLAHNLNLVIYFTSNL